VVDQGEVYDLEVAAAHYRVIVVSSSVHNAVFVPWVVPIRRGHRDAWPYAVPLVDPDPLGGTADMNRLSRAQVGGQPLGMVTGATMQRLREAIAALFAG
jgi:hypothetical protein